MKFPLSVNIGKYLVELWNKHEFSLLLNLILGCELYDVVFYPRSYPLLYACLENSELVGPGDRTPVYWCLSGIVSALFLRMGLFSFDVIKRKTKRPVCLFFLTIINVNYLTFYWHSKLNRSTSKLSFIVANKQILIFVKTISVKKTL